MGRILRSLADWEQSYCAEIDPLCRRLLTRQYPYVTDYGEIRSSWHALPEFQYQRQSRSRMPVALSPPHLA